MKDVKIRSGDMRHRVTLQNQTKARDVTGGMTTTWADVDNVWAAVHPFTGQEMLKAGQIQQATIYAIRIHYRTDINTAYRIKYGRKYFTIQEVINLEMKNVLLELRCTEEVVA